MLEFPTFTVAMIDNFITTQLFKQSNASIQTVGIEKMPNEHNRIKQPNNYNLAPAPNQDNKHAKKAGDGTMNFMVWSITGTALAACSGPIFGGGTDLPGGTAVVGSGAGSGPLRIPESSSGPVSIADNPEFDSVPADGGVYIRPEVVHRPDPQPGPEGAETQAGPGGVDIQDAVIMFRRGALPDGTADVALSVATPTERGVPTGAPTGFDRQTVDNVTFFYVSQANLERLVLSFDDTHQVDADFDIRFHVYDSDNEMFAIDDSTARTVSVEFEANVDDPATGIAIAGTQTVMSIPEADDISQTKIADLMFTGDPDGGNSGTLMLAGANHGLFQIVGTTDGTAIYLREGTDLDFETLDTLNIRVQLEGTPAVGVDISVAVTNVEPGGPGVENDDPATAIRLVGGAQTRDSIAEDVDIPRTEIARLEFDDDDGGSPGMLERVGTHAGMFELDGTVLYLSATALLDFEDLPEDQKTLSVRVRRVDDPETTADETTIGVDVMVTVTDVEGGPGIEAIPITENGPAVPITDAREFASVLDTGGIYIKAEVQNDDGTAQAAEIMFRPADNSGDLAFDGAGAATVAQRGASNADFPAGYSGDRLEFDADNIFYFVSKANLARLVLVPDSDYEGDVSNFQIKFVVYDGVDPNFASDLTAAITADSDAALAAEASTVDVTFTPFNDLPTNLRITGDRDPNTGDSVVSYVLSSEGRLVLTDGMLAGVLSVDDVDTASSDFTFRIDGTNAGRLTVARIDNEWVLQLRDGMDPIAAGETYNIRIIAIDADGGETETGLDLEIIQGGVYLIEPDETDIAGGGNRRYSDYADDDGDGIVSEELNPQDLEALGNPTAAESEFGAVRVEAVKTGPAGNDIEVTFTNNLGLSSDVTIVVDRASGTISVMYGLATVAEIIEAINTHAEARLLIIASDFLGTGTLPNPALNAAVTQNLMGGAGIEVLRTETSGTINEPIMGAQASETFDVSTISDAITIQAIQEGFGGNDIVVNFAPSSDPDATSFEVLGNRIVYYYIQSTTIGDFIADVAANNAVNSLISVTETGGATTRFAEVDSDAIKVGALTFTSLNTGASATTGDAIPQIEVVFTNTGSTGAAPVITTDTSDADMITITINVDPTLADTWTQVYAALTADTAEAREARQYVRVDLDANAAFNTLAGTTGLVATHALAGGGSSIAAQMMAPAATHDVLTYGALTLTARESGDIDTPITLSIVRDGSLIARATPTVVVVDSAITVTIAEDTTTNWRDIYDALRDDSDVTDIAYLSIASGAAQAETLALAPITAVLAGGNDMVVAVPSSPAFVDFYGLIRFQSTEDGVADGAFSVSSRVALRSQNLMPGEVEVTTSTGGTTIELIGGQEVGSDVSTLSGPNTGTSFHLSYGRGTVTAAQIVTAFNSNSVITNHGGIEAVLIGSSTAPMFTQSTATFQLSGGMVAIDAVDATADTIEAFGLTFTADAEGADSGISVVLEFDLADDAMPQVEVSGTTITISVSEDLTDTDLDAIITAIGANGTAAGLVDVALAATGTGSSTLSALGLGGGTGALPTETSSGGAPASVPASVDFLDLIRFEATGTGVEDGDFSVSFERFRSDIGSGSITVTTKTDGNIFEISDGGGFRVGAPFGTYIEKTNTGTIFEISHGGGTVGQIVEAFNSNPFIVGHGGIRAVLIGDDPAARMFNTETAAFELAGEMGVLTPIDFDVPTQPADMGVLGGSIEITSLTPGISRTTGDDIKTIRIAFDSPADTTALLAVSVSEADDEITITITAGSDIHASTSWADVAEALARDASDFVTARLLDGNDGTGTLANYLAGGDTIPLTLSGGDGVPTTPDTLTLGNLLFTSAIAGESSAPDDAIRQVAVQFTTGTLAVAVDDSNDIVVITITVPDALSTSWADIQSEIQSNTQAADYVSVELVDATDTGTLNDYGLPHYNLLDGGTGQSFAISLEGGVDEDLDNMVTRNLNAINLGAINIEGGIDHPEAPAGIVGTRTFFTDTEGFTIIKEGDDFNLYYLGSDTGDADLATPDQLQVNIGIRSVDDDGVSTVIGSAFTYDINLENDASDDAAPSQAPVQQQPQQGVEIYSDDMSGGPSDDIPPQNPEMI